MIWAVLAKECLLSLHIIVTWQTCCLSLNRSVRLDLLGLVQVISTLGRGVVLISWSVMTLPASHGIATEGIHGVIEVLLKTCTSVLVQNLCHDLLAVLCVLPFLRRNRSERSPFSDDTVFHRWMTSNVSLSQIANSCILIRFSRNVIRNLIYFLALEADEKSC